MQMIQLCPPALIYLVFSITQIIIDMLKGLYNTALFKFIFMVMITFLLNALCQEGLSIISWFIVFIPFILMSVIVTMLLYVFVLDVATGKLNYNCQNAQPQSQTQNKTVIVSTQPEPKFPVKIFNPNYNTSPTYPVNETQQQATIFAPNYSSSPEYIS